MLKSAKKVLRSAKAAHSYSWFHYRGKISNPTPKFMPYKTRTGVPGQLSQLGT